MASKLPGLKTKIVVALGALGNVSFALQEYVKGLPLDNIINARNIVILNVVLFTLAFWFRSMADVTPPAEAA